MLKLLNENEIFELYRGGSSGSPKFLQTKGVLGLPQKRTVSNKLNRIFLGAAKWLPAGVQVVSVLDLASS